MSRARDLADSADLNFDSNTLAIDTANNRVGIGTASPSTDLEVAGSKIKITNASGGAQFQGSANGGGMYFDSIGSTTDIIFRQSGSFTERMRIDSAGRVKMPYQPAFHAIGSYTSPNQTAQFNTAVVNVGNNFNASTYTFTAPIDGLYFIYASANAGSVTNTSHFELHKNGAIYAGTQTWAVSSTDDQNSVQGIMQLSANDTVLVRVNASGAELANLGNFGGYLLG